MKTTLAVGGMRCAGCAGRLEKALAAAAGVHQVSVDLSAHRVLVDFDPHQVDRPRLEQEVREAGFSVVDEEPEPAPATRLWIGLALTLALMVLSMGHSMLGSFALSAAYGWVLLALAAPVQWLLGREYYLGALGAWRARSANMDTLIAIGTSVAFLASLAEVAGWHLLGGHFYFETAAVILALVSVGKHLEDKARRRTGEQLRALVELAPKTARLQGSDEPVPVSRLRLDDRVVVLPGEAIPCDGEVLEGDSEVDESLLTGESQPVLKQPGETVTAGTLNGSGRLLVKVSQVGADTRLAQIVALVRRAQASKPEVQRTADRVAAWLVPVILGVAVVTLLAWWAADSLAAGLVHAIAVLVITCPCALGLATPTAVVVGLGKAARFGALFRDATSLEKCARLQTIALDKTGTLSQGRPRVAEAYPAGDSGEAELIRCLATAEQGSRHPLAQAALERAAELELQLEPLQETREVAGHGLESLSQERRIRVGTEAWLKQHGIDTEPLQEQLALVEQAAATPVWVSLDDRLLGLVAIADPLRPESPQVLQELRDLGLKTLLLSGDRRKVAEQIAARLPLDEVHAELLPEQKSELLAGRPHTGMVGDGINDAPALAVAEVGFAMGAGTDVAVESATVTLMGDSLEPLTRALKVARQTMAVIRQNLFWAFFYNLLLVPVAAGVLALVPGTPAALTQLNPMLAAAAMALSSLCVVGNSLRLNLISVD